MASKSRRKSANSANNNNTADDLSSSLGFYTMDSMLSDQNGLDDDGVDPNPLKRRLNDGTVDYPRRRATIAVSKRCI